MAVYFIQAADGAVKIGRAINVNERLRNLQTAHAYPLTLLRVIDGGAVEEWECQSEFNNARVRGEWFEYREAMLTFQPSGSTKVELLRRRRLEFDGVRPTDTLVDVVRESALRNPLKHKDIAEGMGYSPSLLTRKLRQYAEDGCRFTLDDLEKFIQTTGDTQPIYYLIEKYLADDTDRIKKLEEELARLKTTKKVRS